MSPFAGDTLARNRIRGREAEEIIRRKLVGNNRLQLVGEQIRIRTPGAPFWRTTDFLVRNKRTGELFLVEVKSGKATRSLRQLRKDAVIADPDVNTTFFGRRARAIGFPRGTPTGPLKTYEAHVK